MSIANAGHPLYSLRNLRRSYGDREILNIESLDLEASKIYGLLGPNGAGKTTLMRILAFMESPSAGSIKFQMTEVRPEQAGRYRARVVWVQQTPVLFTGSVLYNIEYPMRLKGAKRGPRREKAMELLDCVGLKHLAHSPAHRLSGGEAQRASIARALAAKAEVILFDEPTANVDYRSREQIINLIRGLWQERGLSILLASHDQALVDELCQEKIILIDGKIISKEQALSSAAGQAGADAVVFAKLRANDGNGLAMIIDRPAYEKLGIWPKNIEAVVCGLVENTDGVRLSVILPSGLWVDARFRQADDIMLARRLTLAKTVLIIADQN